MVKKEGKKPGTRNLKGSSRKNLQKHELPMIRNLPNNFQIGRPKKWTYAIACKKTGYALDAIRNSDILNSSLKTQLEANVARAMAYAFEGERHAARNTLTAAYIRCAKSFGGDKLEKKLFHPPLKLKRNGSLGELKNIRYYDQETKTDLWDMVYFTFRDKSGNKHKASGYAAAHIPDMFDYFHQNTLLQRKQSALLAKIGQAAEDLELKSIVEDQAKKQSEQFITLTEQFAAIPRRWHQCELGDYWREKYFPDVNPSQKITNEDLACDFELGFILRRLNISQYMRRKLYDKAEQSLYDEDVIIWHFAAFFTQMNQTIDAANAESRRRIKNIDVWNLIGDCLSGQIKESFEDALDDWYGAKKYIIAAGCTSIFLMSVVGSQGTAFFPAVLSLVWCFVRQMIGSVSNIRGLVTCIVSGNDS
ncbi:MAG: hypothetical protein K8S14_03865 [Actinomycetia bacterium]|nr:hypothetical protein [Actinomycetes bacterium]